ncbi:bifunctional methyltransferase/pyrophosphohydrolase YabN [Marinicrinis sediminis]|uniref:Nucleoside triphosphate pyrophosphohydrolase n=1 Tax=Marinicrinis sediminis TaxID=1652465 RepID=A0ABW5RAB6_9BACL
MSNQGPGLTIVGLGAGASDALTLGVYRAIRNADHLLIRTQDHPVVRFLDEEGIAYQPLDMFYEQHDQFEAVYDAIAKHVMEQVQQGKGSVVYAVPGHPSVAEDVVRRLRMACEEQGIALTILGGESFLDELFIKLQLDPIDGFQLLDAQTIHRDMLNPHLHTVITQVYDRFTASDVKLTLMELYQDDQQVVVAHSLGIEDEEVIANVPLYELDRQSFGNRSLVYVPKSDDGAVLRRTFSQLVRIVNILRSPEGCPWDQEQTHQSIRKNLIEEAYEVIEAIDEEDVQGMEEELGDLMLQVIMHAQMEAETGSFTIWDVLAGINEKLIRRHPHVFGDIAAEDAERALENWEAIKKQEKEQKGQMSPASALSGIPSGLPSLYKAVAIQKKAARVGFDWPQVDPVFDKINEEIEELKASLLGNDKQEMKKELGDVLFAVVNAARMLKIDPEEALGLTNQKFIQRFQYIEKELEQAGKTTASVQLAEMESLWQQAKKHRF